MFQCFVDKLVGFDNSHLLSQCDLIILYMYLDTEMYNINILTSKMFRFNILYEQP